MPTQYLFCRVCRQNHDQGKGHRYSTRHKQRLDALLKKIQKNVQEVGFFLKNALPPKATVGSRAKFWCHFCEQEVREDKSTLACEETIRHLASKQHAEAVKSFWFENGGDVWERRAFFISDVDFCKWEEACKALPPQDVPDFNGNEMNNIHSKRCLADATSAEHVNQISFVCGSSLAVKPLSVLTDQSFLRSYSNGKVQVVAATSSQVLAVDHPGNPQSQHEAHPGGRSLMQDCHVYAGEKDWNRQVATPEEPRLSSIAKGSLSNLPQIHGGNQILNANLEKRESSRGVSFPIRQTESALGPNLTSIRPPPVNPGEGNVHSGAPPPWLKPSTSQGSELQASTVPPSSPTVSLSRTQQRKLAKLRNPNRVGAAWAENRRSEMERERNGEVVERSVPDSSAWLPSFGRVWQSGSRRETRKEFEAEKRSKGRKMSSGQNKRSSNIKLDTPKIRPYVSKRQRTLVGTELME